MIVVCGATGQQGGAVVDALLAQNLGPIRGLTRNLSGTGAQSLRSRGVEMVSADLGNGESLEAAFTGAKAVFAVTQPWSADYTKASPKAEVKQGLAILKAAERNNIEHLVFSTVILDGALRKTGVPHVDSKVEIELALAKSSIPWTVLGPGTFIDNIGTKFLPVGRKSIRGFVSQDAALPYIAVRDIGLAAAKVLAERPAFLQKRVNLIAGMWDGSDVCKALTKVYGRPYSWKAPPRILMRIFAPEFYKMRIGFEMLGRRPFPSAYTEAVESTRKLLPNFWTLEDYVREKRPGPGP
jgi:uncharacterized protein YbjT (DUF2867 family)